VYPARIVSQRLKIRKQVRRLFAEHRTAIMTFMTGLAIFFDLTLRRDGRAMDSHAGDTATAAAVRHATITEQKLAKKVVQLGGHSRRPAYALINLANYRFPQPALYPPFCIW